MYTHIYIWKKIIIISDRRMDAHKHPLSFAQSIPACAMTGPSSRNLADLHREPKRKFSIFSLTNGIIYFFRFYISIFPRVYKSIIIIPRPISQVWLTYLRVYTYTNSKDQISILEKWMIHMGLVRWKLLWSICSTLTHSSDNEYIVICKYYGIMRVSIVFVFVLLRLLLLLKHMNPIRKYSHEYKIIIQPKCEKNLLTIYKYNILRYIT